MKPLFALGLALASLLGTRPAPAQVAETVVHYQPGSGYAIEFGSGLGYTNALVVLGFPATATAEEEPVAVTPFAPPYQKEHLLSLGTNGTLTVRMDTPILNDPANPFGLDFSIFGNTGFLITNGNYSGGGITSGFLFGGNSGQTRVSVSADGETFYLLDPALAPQADAPLPTDAAGDPLLPVNPALVGADFAGRDLPGLRQLYAGSGGGTGFDLAWARDAQGAPVSLHRADFVRIDVLSGKSEIDAITTTLARPAGEGFTETFATDPSARGWSTVGDASLFRWDATRRALQVTWNSARTNSYFHRPLGTTLSAADAFGFTFDLTLDAIAAGVDPAKPTAFQVAVGLLNLTEARRTDFYRGTGLDAQHGARSVVEWNYFPDTGFGTTLSPSVFATNNAAEIAFTFPFDLTLGVPYRVTMEYTPSNRVLRTTMLANGVPMPTIKDVILPADPAFDFRLDALAIASYSDAGQSGEFAGSLLASGWIDNIRAHLPAALVVHALAFQNGVPEARIAARPGWHYVLERTDDWKTWTEAASAPASAAGELILRDNLPAVPQAFYRVRATLP
ncbi:MAG: hypothetical protein IT580_09265 [Verrucomicrobiales bacterium]|nr:hypothetical protein [Verrucomicrobiales bacterium]